MSVHSNTFRALSRTRVPANSSPARSLVPFLYQTTTIQRWRTDSRPIVRRTASSRSRASHDIPFDDIDSLLPNLDDAATPSRKSTVTGPERAAFRKLQHKFGNDAQTRGDIPFDLRDDLVFDEYAEEDDDENVVDASLDTLFDNIIQDNARRKSDKRPRPLEDMKKLAQQVLGGTKEQLERMKEKAREGNKRAIETVRITGAREAEKNRVVQLLEKARTDRELCDVLQREVFNKIQLLDLDNKPARVKASTTTQPESTEDDSAESIQNEKDNERTKKNRKGKKAKEKLQPTDIRIVFPNYPLILVHAATLLRTNFPSSRLPFTILPTIKSLGRSSYALGATTRLYNILLRAAWLQYGSYDMLDELLQDMDNGGIEFNAATLQLLDDILKEFEVCRRGEYGPLVKWTWNLERFSEGATRLRAWREIVGQRLSNWGEAKKRRRMLIRREDVGRQSGEIHSPSDEIEIGRMVPKLRTEKTREIEGNFLRFRGVEAIVDIGNSDRGASKNTLLEKKLEYEDIKEIEDKGRPE
ncbi:hypothetical protein CC78DRAFT_565491 [Lojkania enalia]|uniref:Mtf2-like C-terminal domain-containing protein n=1 Tax=Lojkania enalia TaxID=147567 RepID=A0A9P4KGC2_9PLEO|nr:hypothetical protein CC78DRAFT_565491 [Didymosphaeria enalia]